MAGRYGALERNYKKRKPKYTFTEITMGTVIDTNDPQQMARIRVHCPQLGDTEEKPIAEIPWATAVTPLGGVDQLSARGREDAAANYTQGTVAYGMWNVPNVGTSVLIACIDGDTRFRVYLGCVHGQYMTHTLPHGRYVGDDAGPISCEETPLEPLASGQKAAFNDQLDSPEYASRARDRQVSGLDGEIINSVESNLSAVADDRGYTQSRFDPDLPSSVTGVNKESQIYSWTTPGFHGISMDDNADNCRIRIRSTHGAQIILDDSNERIYIQTSQGKSWIELDEAGNVDIYAEKRISMHCKEDFNIQSDAAVRITGKNGVHIHSDTETRITSGVDTHVSVGGVLHINSDSACELTCDTLAIVTGSTLDITAGSQLNIFANTDFNQLCLGPMKLSATPLVSVNGTPATPPTSTPTASDTFDSWLSMRVPEHEPWGRIVMDDSADGDSGNTQVLEMSYDDPLVGKSERGTAIVRNSNWRR